MYRQYRYFSNKQFKKTLRWWWSSGQRARLMLKQSEFESRRSLQFLLCKNCQKRTKIKWKRGRERPIKIIENAAARCQQDSNLDHRNRRLTRWLPRPYKAFGLKKQFYYVRVTIDKRLRFVSKVFIQLNHTKLVTLN